MHNDRQKRFESISRLRNNFQKYILIVFNFFFIKIILKNKYVNINNNSK